MMDGLKPYLAYKESGVEWLGEVPAHWEVRRLKNAARLIMGQSPSSNYYSVERIGLPFLQGCVEVTRQVSYHKLDAIVSEGYHSSESNSGSKNNERRQANGL